MEHDRCFELQIAVCLPRLPRGLRGVSGGRARASASLGPRTGPGSASGTGTRNARASAWRRGTATAAGAKVWLSLSVSQKETQIHQKLTNNTFLFSIQTVRISPRAFRPFKSTGNWPRFIVNRAAGWSSNPGVSLATPKITFTETGTLTSSRSGIPVSTCFCSDQDYPVISNIIYSLFTICF